MRALLFTDIEGSTALWERAPEAMAGSLARHDRILRDEIEARDGQVFTTAGDSFAAAFDEVAAALDTAVAVQRALAGTAWDPSAAVRVRIGVHVGDTVARDGDHFGPAVNRAARVCDAGHGGQIVVSEDVARLAPTLDLRPLGTHVLKGVSEPVVLHQVVVDGLPQDFPPPRSTGTARSSLPHRRTRLLGRDAELATVRAALAEHRLVTVTGAGGVGKTQLALAAVDGLASDRVDGVVFVDLSPVTDEDAVPGAVASRLHRGGEGPLAAQLVDSDVLLVLDNCEHLVDAVADLVEEVLLAAPAVAVLATSREALDVPGERAIRLRGLAPDAAAALFEVAAVAGAVRDADDRAAVAAVCERLDRIPLAVELAAARTRSIAVRQLPNLLEDRFRLLTGGRRRTRGRQQTLETAIAWSVDLLDPAEAATLQAVAVFAGGFELEVAAELLGLDAVTALERLDALVAKSLVEAVTEDGAVVYALLESIRVFALGRLVAAGRADDVRRRLARIVAADVSSILWGTRGFYLRRPDVFESVAWAERAGDAALRRDLQLAHGAALYLDGRGQEAEAVLRGLLADEQDPSQASMARAALAAVAAYDGDVVAARAELDAALDLDPAHPVALVTTVLLAAPTAALDRARAEADLALLDATTEQRLAGLAPAMRAMLASWDGEWDAAASWAASSLQSLQGSPLTGVRYAVVELRLLALAHGSTPGRSLDWLDEKPGPLSMPSWYADTESGWSYRIDLHAAASIAALRAGDRTRAHRHLADAVALHDQRAPQPLRSRIALSAAAAAIVHDDGDVAGARALLATIDAPSGGLVPGTVHLLADLKDVADDERPTYVRTEPFRRLLLADDVGRAERDRRLEETIARYGLRS